MRCRAGPAHSFQCRKRGVDTVLDTTGGTGGGEVYPPRGIADLLKNRAGCRCFRARMYKTCHLAAQLRCKNGSWICRLPPGRDAGVEQTQGCVCLLNSYVTVPTRQGPLGCARRNNSLSPCFWNKTLGLPSPTFL